MVRGVIEYEGDMARKNNNNAGLEHLAFSAMSGNTNTPGTGGMLAFDQLGTFQQLITTLFMALAQFIDPDNPDNANLNNMFGNILGIGGEENYKDWHTTQKANDWNWKKTQDFSDFKFDDAAKTITTMKLPKLGGKTITDVIAKHESGGNYNIAYGGKQVNFTDMTINDVIAWQKNYTNSGSPSSAAGKYQIIRKTLTGLRDELGLSGNEKFDEAMQDKMAVALMEKRGYSDFLKGEIKEKDFMYNLSKEWASLPKDMSGESYYAGDGLNKALVSPEAVVAALRHEKENIGKENAEQTVASTDRTTSAAKNYDDYQVNSFSKIPEVQKSFKTAANYAHTPIPESTPGLDNQSLVKNGNGPAMNLES